MRKLSRALTGAAMVFALAASAVPAAAEDDVLFEVTDERVQTASGLAADRDRQMYWTVNSTDADRAFALRSDGSVEGTVRFGQAMVDAQAVYYIGSRLYIADIGDADGERDTIAVHRYTEPHPVGQQPETIRTFEMHYSDGQGRDARAMLVGDDGQLFVITHEAEGEIWATQGPPSSGVNNELVQVGDAPAWVTDAVFLGDGRIATRSYTSIDILDAGTYQVAARAPAPWQEQGEAMALSLDRQSLILGSSGSEQPVLRVPIPDDLLDVPEPGSSPPPSPEPTPTPTAEPTEEVEEAPEADDRAGGERTGTMMAVLGAGLLALVSAAVVFFAGSRRPRPAEAGTAVDAQRVSVTEETPDEAGSAVAGAERVVSEPSVESPRDEDEPEVSAAPDDAPLPVTGATAGPASPPAEVLDVPEQPAEDNPFGVPAAPAAPASGVPPVPPAAVPPVSPPPVAAPAPVVAPPPGPLPRRALPPQDDTPADAPPRRSFTISEGDGDVPVRPRPKRASIVEPEHAVDDEGTWVRPRRSAEEQAADLKWLNRG
ncbi:MAG: hypothetical protein GXX86_13265 [Propionibacterium sp.]|nr:hypothetical protein [Propionibacterium sp.]